jgi:hypothetical protein
MAVDSTILSVADEAIRGCVKDAICLWWLSISSCGYDALSSRVSLLRATGVISKVFPVDFTR